jgi:hypothetical protein
MWPSIPENRLTYLVLTLVIALKMTQILVKRVTHFHPKTGWEKARL